MAYNVERFVREAIESILNQTYTDFELLIINDGSTDGSPAIFEEYARFDNRIRIHTQPGNLGIANARKPFEIAARLVRKA
jgi:glycosyltransferase involved in cell wall biosynthesis